MTSSFRSDAPAAEPPGSIWPGYATIMAVATAFAVRAVTTTVAARAVVLPTVLIEIAVWAALMVMLGLRHPHRQLRISDPCIPVLGWCAYYFINPALTWSAGNTFHLENIASIRMSAESVIHAQYMHMIFMVGFVVTYHLVAPRFALSRLSREQIETWLPGAAWMIVLGLLPTLVEVGSRILTSGTLTPTETYGASWGQLQDNLQASRNAGGSDYILAQIFSKIWFFPVMSLGVGYGLLFVRLWGSKRWLALAAFHAQFPVLMYLSIGGRSAVIAPFLIAIVIADFISGPLPWRYLVGVVIVGLMFFNFYGTFREHQTEEIGQAITMTVSDEGENTGAQVVRSEDSGMLVKEVFAIRWTDIAGIERGGDYLVESLLSLVPLQFLPSKATWTNTGTLLSREMLGGAAAYNGVAGAIIADGYMMFREFGVGFLAVLLGAIHGLMVQNLVGSARVGPTVWKIMLLACCSGQSMTFIRFDLGGLLNQILYYVVIPAAIALIVWGAQPANPWRRRLSLG